MIGLIETVGLIRLAFGVVITVGAVALLAWIFTGSRRVDDE